MDTQLTTLGATLDAIARLHESVPSSSKNVYRPFTCAVLNTYKLDVLDYIRDADQVESNLFWYPPQAGGGGVGVAKTEGGEAKKEGEAVATPVGVSARLPEPREYVPPTPLRKTAMEAEAKGLVRFNARTLLKAAQKLLDNYHHAPRAKKHIKALLKRHSELDKLTSQSEMSISYAEGVISKLSHPENGKRAAAEMFGPSKAPLNVDEEMVKLQDAIRNERMEILAIEQTTEDLLERRTKLLSKKARGNPSDKAQRAPGKPTTTSRPQSGSSTPRDVTPKKPSAKPSPKTRSDSQTTPRKVESQQSTPVKKNLTARGSLSIKADDGDTAMREGQAETKRKAEEAVPLTEPESSDELERICENIWTLFGDNLRYVAVDREGADYQDTLRILQDLSIGGAGRSGLAQGDESTVSSSVGSQDTAATSGSTGSSQLENAGPPQPAIEIASHVLFTLLTTPAPHVMDFEELKAEAEAWWRDHGRAAYAASSTGRDASEVGESSGSELASRAVYSLIAKKLLRLQFRGAKRIISFPAHIG